MSRVRAPKIFYVSTKEASTTISTHTVCWVSSTTIAACGRRRRRRAVVEVDGDAPQHVKADLLRSRTCFLIYPVILLLTSWRWAHNADDQLQGI